jgi:hypothetical protein
LLELDDRMGCERGEHGAYQLGKPGGAILKGRASDKVVTSNTKIALLIKQASSLRGRSFVGDVRLVVGASQLSGSVRNYVNGFGAKL